MKRKIIIYIIAGIIIVSAIIFYYNVNPDECVLMPKCILKQLTGFDCPSCGGQRSLHAILHGDFMNAISYNPFFVISIPYLLSVIYATFFKSTFAKKVRRISFNRYVIYTYIVLFFAWWIIRNILFKG